MTASAAPTARRTFWAAAAFYLLIAFEFFYMASPFAAYFYSVYAPGLRTLNAGRATTWLAATFLPHAVVETSSALLDLHNAAGATLFVGGLLVFAVAAVQVYHAKLTHRGAVTGGLYRLTRHPQYVALSVSGFGLLLLWPRFIALVTFVTMLFAYRLLARAEERECSARFGPRYLEYQARWAARDARRQPGHHRVLRGAIAFVSFTAALGAAVALGFAVRQWSLGSLYAVYLPDAAYVSVARVDPAALQRLVDVVTQDAELRTRLRLGAGSGGTRFLNYVLPTDWHVPEIPMRDVPGAHGHAAPRASVAAATRERDQFRIVFTAADLPRGPVEGRRILHDAVGRRPLLEAVVDLRRSAVVDVADPVAQPAYAGIPVPLF